MTTMATAAPGDVPQMPVVSGRTWLRQMSQPSRAAARRVASTRPRNRGQSASTVATMSGVTVPAIMQPSKACTAAKGAAPTRMVRPQAPPMMAATMGPMSRGAGRLTAERSAVSAAEPRTSRVHWAKGRSRGRDSKDRVMVVPGGRAARARA